jgi:membrane-bound metal-dependent hydrolase YbcI (DUF457 family)
MFVGHLAVALGVKRAAPRVPLPTLVAASYGLDLVWPVLLLAGVERVRVAPGNTAFTPLAFDSYPWSHSLVMAVLWGAAAGAAASRLQANRVAALVCAVVVSHWALDFITHRADLPLWPGGPTVGLGLWNSIPGTLVVEGAMFVAALEAYRRAFRPTDAVGSWAFRSLIALTSLIWMSGPWGPPPPSTTAVAIVSLALWVLPVWALWIERHRKGRGAGPRGAP